MRRYPSWAAPILLSTIFLIVGLLSFSDYGVSSDEPAMRQFGLEAYNYLFHGKNVPGAIDWHFHGPVWQVVLAAAERWTGVTDGAAVWALRHLLGYILFAGSVLSFYSLTLRQTKNNRLALLGAIFLLCTPRMFAHAFYNPKDLPTFAFFTIAMLTLVRMLERPSIQRIAVHALLTAITISLRSFGLLIVLLTCLPLLAIAIRKQEQRIHIAKTAGGYIAATIAFTIAVWPMLWGSPLSGFLGALLDNTSRSAGGFYFGQLLTHTPWHYVPVWMALTIPPLYTLCFLIGMFFVGYSLVRSSREFARDSLLLPLALGWLLIPVGMQIVLNIGIFDEWRHLFFIYPAFLLIAIHGVDSLFYLIGTMRHSVLFQRIVMTVFALPLLSTIVWMLRFHPFEFVYFAVPSSWVEGRFDLDYWNLSYRSALEQILAQDKRREILVFPVARTAVASADTLPLEDWERILFVGPGEADYIIDNFQRSGYKELLPRTREIFPIMAGSLRIGAVYSGPDSDGIYDALRWD